jgi:hypothetical protein
MVIGVFRFRVSAFYNLPVNPVNSVKCISEPSLQAPDWGTIGPACDDFDNDGAFSGEKGASMSQSADVRIATAEQRQNLWRSIPEGHRLFAAL